MFQFGQLIKFLQETKMKSKEEADKDGTYAENQHFYFDGATDQ